MRKNLTAIIKNVNLLKLPHTSYLHSLQVCYFKNSNFYANEHAKWVTPRELTQPTPTHTYILRGLLIETSELNFHACFSEIWTSIFQKTLLCVFICFGAASIMTSAFICFNSETSRSWMATALRRFVCVFFVCVLFFLNIPLYNSYTLEQCHFFRTMVQRTITVHRTTQRANTQQCNKSKSVWLNSINYTE